MEASPETTSPNHSNEQNVTMVANYRRNGRFFEEWARAYPAGMRRNTLLALILLLAAIAIAGVLGVMRIYGVGV
jgi:hypothetical protein